MRLLLPEEEEEEDDAKRKAAPTRSSTSKSPRIPKRDANCGGRGPPPPPPTKKKVKHAKILNVLNEIKQHQVESNAVRRALYGFTTSSGIEFLTFDQKHAVRTYLSEAKNAEIFLSCDTEDQEELVENIVKNIDTTSSLDSGYLL